MRILLVEDNPGDVRLVREMLRDGAGPDAELLPVSGLHEAAERLAAPPPDLILLDLHLPDSAGMETLNVVLKAAPTVPVVVLTGTSDRELGLEALRAGAQDYLEKQSLDPGALERTIRHAVERKRLEAVNHFLAEAGRVLAAAIGYEETLQRVGELAVPALGDFCVIDVVQEDGKLSRLHVAHARPEDADLAAELLRLPLDREKPHLLLEVLRTNQPVRVTEIEDRMLVALAQSPEHLALLRRVAARSYMAVPLLARDRLLGILAFASRTRDYTPADLSLAERLARIAALELDNAALYRNLQQALRARDRVLSVVAHDLRNPLGTISMAAELAQEETLTHEQRARQIEIVRRTTVRMNSLIQDLLDVARMEGGQMVLDLAYHDPVGLAAEAVELNQALAEARSLRLLLEPGASPGPVEVDHDRILRVFGNLIGNSIKFTPAGGEVRLHVSGNDDEVRFSITDTGAGISAEDLPNLFIPFWQARRQGSQGAGLGLAISRGIVEAHEGRIEVESELGTGTTVTFTLPRAHDRRRAPPALAEARPA